MGRPRDEGVDHAPGSEAPAFSAWVEDQLEQLDDVEGMPAAEEPAEIPDQFHPAEHEILAIGKRLDEGGDRRERKEWRRELLGLALELAASPADLEKHRLAIGEAYGRVESARTRRHLLRDVANQAEVDSSAVRKILRV